MIFVSKEEGLLERSTEEKEIRESEGREQGKKRPLNQLSFLLLFDQLQSGTHLLTSLSLCQSEKSEKGE